MKWVTNWANAISIRTNKPEMYTKNITLRYPVLANFSGSKIRISLDNYTGNEQAHFAKITIAKAIENTEIDLSTLKIITFNGNSFVDIKPKEKAISDEINFAIEKKRCTCYIYLPGQFYLNASSNNYNSSFKQSLFCYR